MHGTFVLNQPYIKKMLCIVPFSDTKILSLSALLLSWTASDSTKFPLTLTNVSNSDWSNQL